MADTFRTRIAAVLNAHQPDILSRRNNQICECGDGGDSPRWGVEHQADAVIRELGLQPHLAKRIINGKPDQWVRRHVTDWEIVDE